MRETLQPGITKSKPPVVEERHSPGHLLPTVVLSTPFMIETLEYLCHENAADHLDEGKTTLGPTSMFITGQPHGRASRQSSRASLIG